MANLATPRLACDHDDCDRPGGYFSASAPDRTWCKRHAMRNRRGGRVREARLRDFQLDGVRLQAERMRSQWSGSEAIDLSRAVTALVADTQAHRAVMRLALAALESSMYGDREKVRRARSLLAEHLGKVPPDPPVVAPVARPKGPRRHVTDPRLGDRARCGIWLDLDEAKTVGTHELQQAKLAKVPLLSVWPDLCGNCEKLR